MVNEFGNQSRMSGEGVTMKRQGNNYGYIKRKQDISVNHSENMNNDSFDNKYIENMHIDSGGGSGINIGNHNLLMGRRHSKNMDINIYNDDERLETNPDPTFIKHYRQESPPTTKIHNVSRKNHHSHSAQHNSHRRRPRGNSNTQTQTQTQIQTNSKMRHSKQLVITNKDNQDTPIAATKYAIQQTGYYMPNITLNSKMDDNNDNDIDNENDNDDNDYNEPSSVAIPIRVLYRKQTNSIEL